MKISLLESHILDDKLIEKNTLKESRPLNKEHEEYEDDEEDNEKNVSIE